MIFSKNGANVAVSTFIFFTHHLPQNPNSSQTALLLFFFFFLVKSSHSGLLFTILFWQFITKQCERIGSRGETRDDLDSCSLCEWGGGWWWGTIRKKEKWLLTQTRVAELLINNNINVNRNNMSFFSQKLIIKKKTHFGSRL